MSIKSSTIKSCKKLYTIRELTKVLHSSKATVYNWILDYKIAPCGVMQLRTSSPKLYPINGFKRFYKRTYRNGAHSGAPTKQTLKKLDLALNTADEIRFMRLISRARLNIEKTKVIQHS